MRVVKWGAAVAVALMAAAPGAAGVKDGVEKWRAGDHKGAVTEWLPFAARGDADAQFNLGQAYRLGRGVAKDPKIAEDYYRKAAGRGHGPAQERLGLELYGRTETRSEGLRWLERAANSKQARAQYVLGVAHFNGDIAPRNWPLAYAYILQAQNAGIPQAQAALDTMNANIPINDRRRGEEMAQAIAAGTYVSPVAAAQPRPAAAVQSAERPAEKPPVASPVVIKSAAAAPVPPKAEAAVKGWRVQLGAFSQRGLAVEAWTGLKAAQAALVAGVSPVYAQAGEMVKLQLGPFATREDARRLCGRLQTVGRTCFVVNG